jgi:hypothetical protein
MFDLAISRGRIYVVAMQQSDSNFRIWSSPTDQLAWKEDPLVIPVGAGPVPSIQLIFSGGGGWLVEVDRVVTAGARLDKRGRWLDWSPPCTGMNGPVEVAASSATDLVASCNEHVWGGGPIRAAAYVSHDGGVTFQRHAAPVFGAVAAADANNAIIFGAETTSARTVDGGATWHVLVGAHDDVSGASDLGFTTTSQGFVIFSDGAMLMTYDAGATWSAVTLP